MEVDCNPSTDEEKIGGSLGWLFSQSSPFGELQANERSCLKKQSRQTHASSLTSTHTHTPYTHKN